MVEAKTEQRVLDMDNIVEKRLEKRYQDQLTTLESKLQKMSYLANSLKSLPGLLRELQDYKNKITQDLRSFTESVAFCLNSFKTQVKFCFKGIVFNRTSVHSSRPIYSILLISLKFLKRQFSLILV